jgi:hypothetical protein
MGPDRGLPMSVSASHSFGGEDAVCDERDWDYEIAIVLVMFWFILSTAAGWFCGS